MNSKTTQVYNQCLKNSNGFVGNNKLVIDYVACRVKISMVARMSRCDVAKRNKHKGERKVEKI